MLTATFFASQPEGPELIHLTTRQEILHRLSHRSSQCNDAELMDDGTNSMTGDRRRHLERRLGGAVGSTQYGKSKPLQMPIIHTTSWAWQDCVEKFRREPGAHLPADQAGEERCTSSANNCSVNAPITQVTFGVFGTTLEDGNDIWSTDWKAHCYTSALHRDWCVTWEITLSSEDKWKRGDCRSRAFFSQPGSPAGRLIPPKRSLILPASTAVTH